MMVGQNAAAAIPANEASAVMSSVRAFGAGR